MSDPTSAPSKWQSMRARLTQAAAAIGATLERTPEQLGAVLDERARALAQPPQAPEAGQVEEHLLFALNGSRYAVQSANVRTVMRMGPPVAVPGQPGAFIGITNQRGLLVPVVDLGSYLGLPRADVGTVPWLIVLGHGGPDLGLAVGAVEELSMLRIDDLAGPPSAPDRERRGLIRGVTSGRVIVLDAITLLTDPELVCRREDAVQMRVDRRKFNGT